MASKTAIGKLSDWLATQKGRVVTNYFYGFGAALVILGALFKIMHFQGAGIMLMLGMGTEVILFIIGAFERPTMDPEVQQVNYSPMPGMGAVGITPEINEKLQESVTLLNQSAQELHKAAVLTSNLDAYVQSVHSIAEDAKVMKASTAAISDVSAGLAEQYSGMGAHVQSIKKSNELFDEQMKQLNENILGLNNVYKEQMNTAVTQMNAVANLHNELALAESNYKGSAEDSAKFKAESARLVGQLTELNSIYAKMISAMSK